MEHKGTKRIETERLILRPFTAQDGPFMFKNWCSDPDVNRFLTWPVHASVEVSNRLAALWEEKANKPDVYQWAIVYKEIGEPIGSLAVVRCWEETSRCELGYCIGKAWWGKGIMTEAVKAVVSYLIQDVGFNRVGACHDVNNPASGKVMRKSGMTFEGVLRQAGRNNQGLCDEAVYAILAEDFEGKYRNV